MQQINLNLVPSGVPPVVYASQYDVGRTFRINLYDGNDSYTVPDGAVITLIGTKTDMHSFAYSSEDDDPKVKVDGSSITVTTTEQMCAMPGTTLCEISVRKSTTLVIGSLNFILQVEKAIVPEDGSMSASDLNLFQEAIDRTRESEKAAANSAKEAKEYRDQAQIISDNFNKGALYSSDIIVPAADWQGTEPPYTYEIPGLTDENTVLLDWATPQTTEEEREIIKDAELAGSKNNMIYAYGSKPYRDVPIRLVYLKGEA